MNLPTDIKKVLSRFEENGFEAFLVGGWVRDYLLNKNPLDFDITTSATPDEVKKIFEGNRVIETGIKHGTVTLLFGDFSIEITTYRVEKGYSDNRHPDNISFSRNINDDLSRRDFTVNAICYSPKMGYLDPFMGKEDIKNKLLKTVGNPEERFNEDALRILRLLRFGAVLDFKIDKCTALAALNLRDSLKSISKERIFAELKKLMSGIGAAEILKEYFKIIATALELDSFKTPTNFSNLKKCYGKDLSLIFAAFFICLFKSDITKKAEEILTKLKSDNAFKKDVINTISGYCNFVPSDKIGVKQLLFNTEPKILSNIFELWHIFEKISTSKNNELQVMLKEILKGDECYKISQLDINGTDLLNLKVAPIEIGKTLEKLLQAVVEENYPNNKESLIKYLNNL